MPNPNRLEPGSQEGLSAAAAAAHGGEVWEVSTTRGLNQAAPDIGPATAVQVIEGELKVAARTALGFQFHWLREVCCGRFEGDLGLPVLTASVPEVEYCLTGQFPVAVRHDDVGWTRLRVLNSASAEAHDTQLRVKATAHSEPPQPHDDLLAAILGVHPFQWLEELRGLPGVRRSRGRAEAHRFGVSYATFHEVLTAWVEADPAVRVAMWHALASPTEFETLREWLVTAAAADSDDGGQWTGLPPWDPDPGHAAVPLNLLAELLEGLPSSGLDDLEEAARLRRAARTAQRWLRCPDGASLLRKFRKVADRKFRLDEISPQLEHLAAFQRLDGWVARQLTTYFGQVQCEADLHWLRMHFLKLPELCREIHCGALAGLAKKCSVELARRLQSVRGGTVLLDCSFDSSRQGREACCQAAGGDFSALTTPGPHMRVHGGILASAVSRRTMLELNLPLLRRDEWHQFLNTGAHVKVHAEENGKLFLFDPRREEETQVRLRHQARLAVLCNHSHARHHSPPEFSLTFTDTRRLAPAAVGIVLPRVLDAYGFHTGVATRLTGLASTCEGPLKTRITLSTPGSAARAWLNSPGEGHPSYRPTYARVARALQRALRLWAPYVYFSELDRFEDLDPALSMAVYSCSRVSSSKKRSHFGYDYVAEAEMEGAVLASQRAVSLEMRRIFPFLVAAGKELLAQHYSPRQTGGILSQVLRRPRLFISLLAADVFFMDVLIQMASQGHSAVRLARENGLDGDKQLIRLVERSVHNVEGKLARLYGSVDFTPLGSLLLIEATAALSEALGEPAPIHGILRVSALRQGDERPLSLTFVNSRGSN